MGSQPWCDKDKVRKRPWTAEEDVVSYDLLDPMELTKVLDGGYGETMEGYSSAGSTSIFASENRHESQIGFVTGGFDDILWAETEWTTPFNGESGSAINSGAVEPLNNQQLNQVETSEASFQTETGGGKSNLTPAQREKKRKCDAKYRQKIGVKIRSLHGLKPGCSKVDKREAMLDETIEYVQSLQRQVKEKSAEQNEHLKEENERLNAENARLKEQIGLLGKQLQHQSVSLQDHHGTNSEAVDKDHHGTNSEAVDKLCSSEMNELQNLHDEMVSVNALSSMPGGGIVLTSNVKSQLNATEAPRDACLQVQEIPHKKVRESESVLPSNEEVKQGTCGSGNESEKAEFSSGGAEDEPSALDGISGEPSDKVLISVKRKRSAEDAEVDQAKGGQLPKEAAKDSAEDQEKGDRSLTIMTDKSTGKRGRGGSQTSDPPIEYIHIGVRRGQETTCVSLEEGVRIQKIDERMKILQDLVPGCSKVTGKAEMLDETINYVQSLQRQVEFLSLQLSASHPISNGDADATFTEILMKLEADDESTVKLSDFTGLDGERIKVGKYSVPLSLHPKNIIDDYGDVSVTCKMNPCAAEANYVLFCASVKEMSDLWLKQVTEDRILKWRDAIKDTLRSNFKVDFAMEHLKKIACAYIGLMERQKLENLALRIVHFEAL